MLKNLFKVLSLVLVLAACLSFASCDSSDTNTGSSGNNTQNPGSNQTTPNGTLDIRIDSEQLITNTKYEIRITSPDIYLSGGIEGMVFSLVNNGAEAIIENGFITAKKAGGVTLKVTYTDERGNLAVGQKEFVFAAPSVTLKEYTNVLYVGDNVELGYKLDKNYDNFQGVTYEVVKGDAKIFANDKGVQYIRASKAGEVTVAITYKAKDIEIKGEGTLTFNDHNFVISSPNAVEYVGYDVVMNATCGTIN